MTPEQWQRTQELFFSALEQPTHVRAEWLAQACAGDDLIHREIEAMLAARANAGDFLQAPALEENGDWFHRAVDAPLGERRIGTYRLVRELGRGGMGRVYLAERADGEFTQQAAIKLIGREMEGEETRRRFLAERQILARLSHPNIARLLDGGTAADGTPYLVMEFVEGKPIDLYCRERELSVRERLRLFQQLCDAVQYSHQHFILHRDLKPQNILVTPDGKPKLLDFGIAKLLDPTQVAADLTQSGQRMMTPEYASPEQIRGDSISMASDVYALGVLLYRLLTGVRPYRLTAESPHELAQAICEQGPARPSARAAEAGLRRALAGDLDDIVLKALRKEPAARYSSVEQFAEDLRRYFAGLPVLARRGTAAYRTGKFLQRHRGALATAAMVVLALCSLTISLYNARRAEAAETREERQRAVAETQQLRAEREKAESEAARAWAEAAQSQAEAQRLQTLRARADATSQNARAENLLIELRLLTKTMLHEVQNEVIKLPGSLRVRELLVKRGLEYLNRLSPQAGNNPALRRELAAAYERVGDLLGNSTSGDFGDLAGARLSYRRALALRQTLPQTRANAWLDRYHLVVNYRKLGNVSRTDRQNAEAAACYKQALSLIEDWNKTHPADQRLRKQEAFIHRLLGAQLREIGDQVGAHAHARQAQTLLKHLLAQGPLDPLPEEWAKGHEYFELGALSKELGNLDEALSYFQEHLAIRTAELATAPDNTVFRHSLAGAHMRVGDVLLRLRRPGQAARHFRQALAIFEELLAQDPENARGKNSVTSAQRKLAQALKENNE